MVAVNMRNCAHIIKTPAAMSCSSETTKEVNARPTAATNEPTATTDCTLISFTILRGD